MISYADLWTDVYTFKCLKELRIYLILYLILSVVLRLPMMKVNDTVSTALKELTLCILFNKVNGVKHCTNGVKHCKHCTIVIPGVEIIICMQL